MLVIFLKLGVVAILLNEIRGLIMAGPVLYALYLSGGTLSAIIVGISALGGIALSVIIPMLAIRKINKISTT